eukprot:Lankesteria_metandrocarpae@DN2346_c0_g1_i1.p1
MFSRIVLALPCFVWVVSNLTIPTYPELRDVLAAGNNPIDIFGQQPNTQPTNYGKEPTNSVMPPAGVVNASVGKHQMGNLMNFRTGMGYGNLAVGAGTIGVVRELGRLDNQPINSVLMQSSQNRNIFQSGYLDGRMTVSAASQQGKRHPNEDFFGVFHGRDLGMRTYTLMVLADGHGVSSHDFMVYDKGSQSMKWNLPAPGGSVSEAVVTEAHNFFTNWLTQAKHDVNSAYHFIPSMIKAITVSLDAMNTKFDNVLTNSGSTVSVTLLADVGKKIRVYVGNLGDSPGFMANHFPRGNIPSVFRRIMKEHNISVPRERQLAGVRLEEQGYQCVSPVAGSDSLVYMRSEDDRYTLTQSYIVRDGGGLQVTGSLGDYAQYEAKRNFIRLEDTNKHWLYPCNTCVAVVVLASDGISDKFHRMEPKMRWEKVVTSMLEPAVRDFLAGEEQMTHQVVQDIASNDYRYTLDDTTLVVLMIRGYGYTKKKKKV